MALTTPLYKQVFTEAALTLLGQAKRMGGGLGPAWALRRPRIRSSPLGPVEPDVVRRHTVLLRYLSITEAYIDALMADLLAQKLGPPSALLRSMVHEIELAASANWSKRHESFKRIHGFQLSKCDAWKEVDGATYARNSIAHGLGRLTASQRQNPNFATLVGRIGISVSGGAIVVSDAAVDAVFDACRRFIIAVDSAT